MKNSVIDHIMKSSFKTIIVLLLFLISALPSSAKTFIIEINKENSKDLHEILLRTKSMICDKDKIIIRYETGRYDINPTDAMIREY